MKFDERTMDVLKNFSSINPSILFEPGETLRTISPSKSVLAIARMGDDYDIDQEIGIYNLPRFLSVLSLFDLDKMSVTKEENQWKFSQDDKEISYVFTDRGSIFTVPKELNLITTDDVKFRLSWADINAAMKAATTLSLPELAVSGINGGLYLRAVDSKGDIRDGYTMRIGDCDKNFDMLIKKENMKLIQRDTYEVSVGIATKIAHFKADDIEYYVAVKATTN